ncbi:hypothetical protein SERLA73DRAFT_159100 [Serpula lacrymans var. lacrymans S7.3]|uniref:ABM domain-containing protein n=2 Tax=Serpula lacrymans var. lacrymans TaxID=341189 RepID=F8PPD5_SERL3|nr:uncharacterized protein SERLADRAFT_413965 [Serpula lacrymans var. lacrymans S7.9]EGO02012.1 hypothetical protein SERLA73DRAFT_159100 [Serpula lacrymans var. lacrymans S7.3]EGO27635.1 hypothetical protein SERLADRAFT_413965 [Serpula lacrymans var. lacrymans S7.9]
MSDPIHVTEFLTLTSTDAIKTTDHFRELVDIIRKEIPTFQSYHWGDRVQEPGIRQLIICFGDDPRDKYTPALLKSLDDKLNLISTSYERKFFVLNPFLPGKYFSAPYTEVIFATTKPDINLEEFNKVCNASLRPCDVFPGCYGTSWGYYIGKGEEIVMVLGWESPEHHQAFHKTDICKTTTAPFLEMVSDAKWFYIQARED